MTQAETSALSESTPSQSWWRRWLVDPIKNQLVQGVAPGKLGWAAAVGVTIGIIPLMGTVSVLSVAAAATFQIESALGPPVYADCLAAALLVDCSLHSSRSKNPWRGVAYDNGA